LSIFVGALGLPKEEFESAIVGFKGKPTIIFNTKSNLNVNDKLPDKPESSYTKNARTEKGRNILYNNDGDMREPNSESSARSGQRRGQGSKTTVIMERSARNASTLQVIYNQDEELTQKAYQKSQATDTSRSNDQSSGVNFTNVLCAAFTLIDHESIKKIDNLIVIFTLLGSVRVKAVHRMLMKLSPGLKGATGKQDVKEEGDCDNKIVYANNSIEGMSMEDLEDLN